MLISNHVLAGASVGALCPSVPTALGVGVLSHFALDAVPHFGKVAATHRLAVCVVDGLSGLVLCAAVLYRAPAQDRIRVGVGIFGACLPDTDKPLRLFFSNPYHPEWFIRFHGRIQTEHEVWLQEVAVAFMLAGVVGYVFHNHRVAGETFDTRCDKPDPTSKRFLGRIKNKVAAKMFPVVSGL